MPGAIAAALGVTEQAGHELSETIVDFLRERNLLLVLDNFEHVGAAWRVVSRLIDSAPGLKILITSRRALHIRGEIEHSLEPLALPKALEAVADLDQVAAAPAVRLLLERGRAARPGFALSVGNADAVVQICSRVGGLPLALELAGAQLRQRSEVSVLRGLDSMMHAAPALVDLPARQRTLGATIAWSYQLLEPAERRAFERMGAFTGDPTIEAASRVVPGHRERSVESIDAVTDHSLAGRRFDSVGRVSSDHADSYPRVRAGPARPATRCPRSAGTARPALPSMVSAAGVGAARAEPEVALSRLRAERADLIAAFHWSAGRSETNELALGFVGELWHLWELTGEVAVPGAIAQIAVNAITPTPISWSRRGHRAVWPPCAGLRDGSTRLQICIDLLSRRFAEATMMPAWRGHRCVWPFRRCRWTIRRQRSSSSARRWPIPGPATASAPAASFYAGCCSSKLEQAGGGGHVVRRGCRNGAQDW